MDSLDCYGFTICEMWQEIVNLFDGSGSSGLESFAENAGRFETFTAVSAYSAPVCGGASHKRNGQRATPLRRKTCL